jgi:hypothetical protein
VKPEGDFRVGLRRQRDAAGAGDRQPRRCRGDLSVQLAAAAGQGSGNLSHAFLCDEQIVEAEPDVVPRQIERAAPAGGELDHARRLR